MSSPSARAATSPFDRLPDELVSKILSLAISSRYDPDVERLYLNKRFSRLARPVLARDIGPLEGVQTFMLRGLLIRPDLHSYVRSLTFSAHEDPTVFSYECAVIHFLPNLSSLALYQEGEDSYDLSREFTEALRTLRSLQYLSLDFDGPLRLEDSSYTIGNDLPKLRSLEIVSRHAGRSCTQQLLQVPISGLLHLSLFDRNPDTRGYGAVPWATLLSYTLSFPFSPDEQDSYRAPLASLESALSFFRLQKLKLEPTLFGQKPWSMGEGAATTLFALLDRIASLQEIHVVLHRDFVLPKLNTLAHVKVLLIRCGLANMQSGPHLGLAKFGPTDGNLRPPSVEFFLAHTQLLALLYYLKQSHILSFTWSRRYDDRYVWTRQNDAEEFQLDRYSGT
ncbi:hypothetical protein JCM11641_001925 [Rhodosporidiobolus odoratus]